ncbi:hypothetical protein Q7P35_000023 [Cladosporium inversicolor]
MSSFFPTLLFLTLLAYYMYSMDTTHAGIILYLLVANVAEPFRTLARYIKLDTFTHTCWMSVILCWLFHQYDFGAASLFVFFCWELAVFQLIEYLDPQATQNNDFVYFGLLPILLTLYHESRGLLVRRVG